MKKIVLLLIMLITYSTLNAQLLEYIYVDSLAKGVSTDKVILAVPSGFRDPSLKLSTWDGLYTTERTEEAKEIKKIERHKFYEAFGVEAEKYAEEFEKMKMYIVFDKNFNMVAVSVSFSTEGVSKAKVDEAEDKIYKWIMSHQDVSYLKPHLIFSTWDSMIHSTYHIYVKRILDL